MICPACDEQMIVVEYRRIELDWCHACQGVWFDADELELLLDAIGLSTAGVVRDADAGAATSEKKRKCPTCRRKMQKVLIGEGDVVVDRCRFGHGLWFDGGELDEVVRRLQGGPTGAGASAGDAGRAGEKVGSFLADVLLAGDSDSEKGGES